MSHSKLIWNGWWQLVSSGYYCTPNSCNIENQGRTASEWYSPPFPHSSVARDLPGWVWQPSGSLHLPAFLDRSVIPYIFSSWCNWQIASSLVLGCTGRWQQILPCALPQPPTHLCCREDLRSHSVKSPTFSPAFHTPTPITASCSTAQRHRDSVQGRGGVSFKDLTILCLLQGA